MLSTSIVSKVITYTATVKYTTFNTLLSPCDFLQNSLADDIVKDLGLSSASIDSCEVISVSNINGQNLYVFEVTVLV